MPVFNNITQYILVLLLIGLILAVMNYLLGFSKEKRARIREAKLVFSCLLKNDLDLIIQSRVDASKVLTGKEDSYEKVKNLLRPNLHFWEKKGFDSAWEMFFYTPENTRISFLEQYMDFGSLTKRNKCHELLGQRVRVLLKFAQVQP